MSRKKLILVGLAFLLTGSIGLYEILYAPLVRKLKTGLTQCAALEKEVAQARAGIASLKDLDPEGPRLELLAESEIPSAIDELTKAAQAKKIKFVTLTPGQAPEPSGSSFRVLPIEIEAESGYTELGTFLGAIERLPKGLFTVKGFEIFPDPRNPALLKSRLSLALYLAGSENAK